MPIYTYEAVSSSGQDAAGTLEAESRSEAIHLIRKRGFQPITVSESGNGFAAESADSDALSERAEVHVPPQAKLRRGRISRRDLPGFTRQLATLLRAGIPVSQALLILSEQCETEALSRLTLQIRDDISEGASLSEAMAQHPKLFGRLYVNMVRVGEQGGILDSILSQLTSFLEADRELRSSLTTALVYPIVVLSLGFLSVLTLTFFVIPQLSELFADFNADLPLLTRVMIGGSDWLISWWWLIVLGGGVAFVGLRKFLARQDVREVIDIQLLRAPLLGPLLTKAHIARFSRTMGTLVGSGIPVLTAIELVAETTGSPMMSHALREAADKVRKGEGVSDPLKQTGLFPPMVTNMIGVGERSGSLDNMLNQIASAYDVELQQAVKRFVTILEPLLILLLALVVGTIIAAFLFPILSLSEVLS